MPEPSKSDGAPTRVRPDSITTAGPRTFIGRKLHTALLQSDSVVLTTLAVCIGILAGFGAVAFHMLLEQTHELLAAGAELLLHLPTLQARGWTGEWIVVLFPAIGALVAIGLIRLFARHDQSHGTSAVIESVALRGGWLPARALLTKVVAAAIFIGSGGSAGPEDPSVQLGAVAGSQFGLRLRLSSRRVRTLVASGVAGAVAAAFNAPIAGVFFAFEIVVGQLSAALFPPIVLAAVAASAIGRWLMGNSPAFRVPSYTLTEPLLEFPLYAILGVLTALVGVGFIRLIFALEDLQQRFNPPKLLRGLLVGLGVGLVGLHLPEVLGVGYDTIGSVLSGEVYNADQLLLLLTAKLLLTALCLTVVGVGGTFAPSLYLGAMTGALVGMAADTFFPQVPAPAFALVGMGGVLTAVVRAPITSVLLLFELTNDYRIILPIMLCVAAGNLVAGHLFKESVYTERLARHGIVLRYGHDLNVMEMVRVEEAMTRKLDTIAADAPLRAAVDMFNVTHHHGLPVVERDAATPPGEERLVGIVSLSDVARAFKRGLDQDSPVITVATTDLLVIYPDQSLNEALRTFAIRDVGRLPVVERSNPQRLVGVLRRPDVVRAYSTGVMRRSELEQRIQQMKMRSHSGSEVVELLVDKNSALAGRMVRDIPLPTQCLLATVRRGEQTQLPRGNTVLQPEDRLTFLTAPDTVEQLEQLCSASRTERVDVHTSPRYRRVQIPAEAPAAGKAVRALRLPAGVLLVSVERAGDTLVPRGDTVIKAGDVVTLFAEPDNLPRALKLLSRPDGTGPQV
jgi:chloride channel protein, CIC family